jgi:cytosine permease
MPARLDSDLEAIPATSGGSVIEDYANAPVPHSRTVNGWRVAMIVTGFNIALPGFLNGAQIATALGLSRAVLVALLAGVLLCAMGCLTAAVSVRTRLTTYVLVQRSFGRSGAALVNIIMALVHFGWFGVNASFFGAAMVAATQELFGITAPFSVFVLVGGMLMALTTIFGFKALDKLALIAVPILAVILGLVLVIATRKYGVATAPRLDAPVPMSFGVALTSLVGSNMMTVATMPDLTRYVRTRGQAVVGMLLSFPLATPLLMLVAAVPALATGETDIMRLIVGFGLGVPALLVLILSTWTINSANLYSASLSLTATFPHISQWKFTLLAGACGSLLAVAGIIDAFVSFLLVLGIIIPPIAAIYVIDAFCSDRAETALRWAAIVTWLCAVAIALLAHVGYLTLTTVPALDATLAATAIHGGWTYWRNRSAHEADGG